MKTNEEKLKKLLEVACNNGWNKITYEIQSIRIKDYFVQFGTWSGDYHWFSLNDLVTNFEPNEISFVEALCKHSDKHFKGVLEKTEDLVWFEGMEMWEQIVTSWTTKKEYYGYRNVDYRYSIRPTSQRLEWLYQTFNHLLV